MAGRELQQLGEDAAERLIRGLGMTVLARNWRSKLGELDLVAMDRDTLVFVEVKCRSEGGLYEPSHAVDHRKRARLRRLAGAFMALEKPRFHNCRFDVVSVVASSPPRLDHVVDAF